MLGGQQPPQSQSQSQSQPQASSTPAATTATTAAIEHTATAAATIASEHTAAAPMTPVKNKTKLMGPDAAETPSKFMDSLTLLSAKKPPASFAQSLESEKPSALLFADDDWDRPENSNVSLQQEPLLVPNKRRFVLFPIQYHNVWTAYKNAEARFWSAEEIELYDDMSGFEKLSGKEKAIILHAVSTLCSNDLLQGGEPIVSRLSDEIQIPEARCYFGFQIMQNNIHAEFFNVAMDALESNAEEKSFLLSTMKSLPSSSKKLAWIQAHLTDSSAPFSTRIFAYAVYTSLFHTAITTLLFHLTPPPTPTASVTTATPQKSHPSRSAIAANLIRDTIGASPLPGLLHGLSKFHHDRLRTRNFCHILLNHCVNAVPRQDAIRIVMEAIAIETLVIRECLELSGNRLTLTRGLVVEKEVVERVKRIGRDMLKSFLGIVVDEDVFGVNVVVNEKKEEKSGSGTTRDVTDEMKGCMWVDKILEADAVKDEKDDVVQNVSVKTQQTPQQKKEAMTFSLDEDF